MVRPDPNLRDRYPALCAWLDEDLRKLPGEPAKAHVWARFLRYSGLDEPTARDALEPEAIRCPTLTVTELPGAFARFEPPNAIVLAKRVADAFGARGNDPDMVLFLEATLLHELVHWGDARDGLIDTGVGDDDLGTRFEIDAYGGVVPFTAADGFFRPVRMPAAAPEAPPMVGGVPFAILSAPDACWPVETGDAGRLIVPRRQGAGWVGRPARAFGADREKRFHAGVDLAAQPGDLVRATESGVVAFDHHFYAGTDALLVQCDSGIVINYGEVAHDSWREFGLQRGSAVSAGAPIARVGRTRHGAMLHFETYRRGTPRTAPWFKSEGPPGELLNPTKYLMELARRTEEG